MVKLLASERGTYAEQSKYASVGSPTNRVSSGEWSAIKLDGLHAQNLALLSEAEQQAKEEQRQIRTWVVSSNNEVKALRQDYLDDLGREEQELEAMATKAGKIDTNGFMYYVNKHFDCLKQAGKPLPKLGNTSNKTTSMEKQGKKTARREQ